MIFEFLENLCWEDQKYMLAGNVCSLQGTHEDGGGNIVGFISFLILHDKKIHYKFNCFFKVQD